MVEEIQIISLLFQEEGVRHSPYLDSLGFPTIGVGFKIGPQEAPIGYYTFTLSESIINIWLSEEVAKVQNAMLNNKEIYQAFEHCNQPRWDILTSMAYQMGCTGLKGFHKMLNAMKNDNWEDAANNMLDSTWAKQTRERALRHAEVIKSGQWLPTYKFI